MKLGIMQPYFFPYIGYFQLIASVDKFMLYELVSFRKKSWMTRNYILPHNHDPLIISVPVRDKSSGKDIQDIVIENGCNWQNKLLKTLYNTYKKATFFDETFTLMEELLNQSYDYLHQFNSVSLMSICKHLKISTPITFRHDEYIALEEELKNKFDNSVENVLRSQPDRKSERIIKICHAECATTYHNPPGGSCLYDKNVFQSHGVDLRFVMPDLKSYRQFDQQFIPNLSVIDVLMHNGAEKTAEMLHDYSLL